MHSCPEISSIIAHKQAFCQLSQCSCALIPIPIAASSSDIQKKRKHLGIDASSHSQSIWPLNAMSHCLITIQVTHKLLTKIFTLHTHAHPWKATHITLNSSHTHTNDLRKFHSGVCVKGITFCSSHTWKVAILTRNVTSSNTVWDITWMNDQSMNLAKCMTALEQVTVKISKVYKISGFFLKDTCPSGTCRHSANWYPLLK